MYEPIYGVCASFGQAVLAYIVITVTHAGDRSWSTKAGFNVFFIYVSTLSNCLCSPLKGFIVSFA